jgi:tyrosine-protein kinase Etk/Wzc
MWMFMQRQNDNDLVEKSSGTQSDANLVDYLNVLVKHGRLIGYTVCVALILSTIVSLLLPKMYTATARILPPRENSTGLSSLLSGQEDPLGGLAGNLIGNQTPAALYVGIMKSRSVADSLNQKFNLKELYDLKYIEDVYSTLAKRSAIEISKKDQLIYVSVSDRDPVRAADMANAYVNMLDRFNRKLNITQGKRKRLFLEDRLKEVRADLEKAEMDLKIFQEKYRLVSIEEQAKAAIEGAAEIKGQIIAAQTELEVLKQIGTEKQIEAVMLKARIEELQKQLDSINQGEKFDAGVPGSPEAGTGSNFYIPFDDLPRLGMHLMRLTREAKIQEKLFELLTSQYEIARIEEAKDVNTVQVLDEAVAPEKKDSPKRTRIVLVSTSLAFVGALLAVFVRHHHHRITL